MLFSPNPGAMQIQFYHKMLGIFDFHFCNFFRCSIRDTSPTAATSRLGGVIFVLLTCECAL